MLFGSVFQPPDPFFVRRTTDDPLAAEFIWSKVCENEVAPVGAAWDELVANPDRHVQNLLFDGGKWWLFDHNLALQPLSKLYSSIDQESAQAKIIDYVARVNQILDQLKQRRPHDHGVREEADKMLRQSKRLKILAIEMEKWQVDRRFSETIKMAALIVNLIALRLAPLALYVDRRLEVPTEDSLWSQS
ncbi:hypothetical protein F3J20_16155 [Paraburkholderia sp. Cy-641]|nr:hypothetical protein [Paraburkholderia sp. Cy-641]